jgi:hypothetical protein
MSMIVRADDDTPERKAIKQAAMQHFAGMKHHKKATDHVEVTEAIPVGKFDLVASETPDGYVKIDFIPVP